MLEKKRIRVCLYTFQSTVVSFDAPKNTSQISTKLNIYSQICVTTNGQNKFRLNSYRNVITQREYPTEQAAVDTKTTVLNSKKSIVACIWEEFVLTLQG